MNIGRLLTNVMKRLSLKTALTRVSGLLIVLSASFIVVVILILLLSQEPARAMRFFFLGPFLNLFYFGNTLNRATPLIFTGLGIALAFKSGNMNLGGEGQVYAGGLTANMVALSLVTLGGFLGGIIALAAGALMGGLIAGVSGVLKMKWRTNEIISSFLLSNAVILVVHYLITGPFKDPQTNLLATRRIPEAFRFSRIMLPSNLNTTFFFALIAVIIVFLYIYKSRSGYEMRMCGQNSTFAHFGGIKVGTYIALPMFLSGVLHGLAGGMAIFGTHHLTIKEFSAGMGWNGIAVALIAKQNPLAVIPAAIFFAYIDSGANIAMLHSDVTFEIASIVQSVVFFLVTAETIYALTKKKRAVV